MKSTCTVFSEYHSEPSAEFVAIFAQVTEEHRYRLMTGIWNQLNTSIAEVSPSISLQ